jgi:transcriptional regulator GlxA family with amidase domain
METSVCTGARLLGAAGRLRGKRATTHHASLDMLAKHGAVVGSAEGGTTRTAKAVPRTRVVRDGQLMTAGGVTSAMDLGLAIVDWLYGDEARARIAARMGILPPQNDNTRALLHRRRLDISIGGVAPRFNWLWACRRLSGVRVRMRTRTRSAARPRAARSFWIR